MGLTCKFDIVRRKKVPVTLRGQKVDDHLNGFLSDLRLVYLDEQEDTLKRSSSLFL